MKIEQSISSLIHEERKMMPNNLCCKNAKVMRRGSSPSLLIVKSFSHCPVPSRDQEKGPSEQDRARKQPCKRTDPPAEEKTSPTIDTRKGPSQQTLARHPNPSFTISQFSGNPTPALKLLTLSLTASNSLTASPCLSLPTFQCSLTLSSSLTA